MEFGLDSNSNGVLDLNEINNTLTKYVCNGVANSNNGLTFTDNPSNVILLHDFTTTYTVPVGTKAKISNFIASNRFPINISYSLFINGIRVYIDIGTLAGGGVGYTYHNSNNPFVIKGDIWLPEGTTISIPNDPLYGYPLVFIQEYVNTPFDVKIISNLTIVPANKKWKIVSILPYILSESHNFYIKINGVQYDIGMTGLTAGMYGTYFYNSILSGDLWLPAGTTLNINPWGDVVLGIIVLEY